MDETTNESEASFVAPEPEHVHDFVRAVTTNDGVALACDCGEREVVQPAADGASDFGPSVEDADTFAPPAKVSPAKRLFGGGAQ